jgi:Transposase DDE domain
MLQTKDIKSVEELKKYFSSSTKMVDHLTSLLSFFEFKRVYNVLNTFKKRGYSLNTIFPVLVILPFLKHASIHALFKSRSKDLCCADKDAYYRFKNLEIIPWRRLLLNFVRRFIFIVEKKGQAETKAKRCLIIDDSLLHKTGKAIEFVGKLWDHVDHGYKLGLRLLLLCYYDGKSNLPLDFSLHREKGKNEQKPYGLTKKQLKGQHTKCRVQDSESEKRSREVDMSKMDVGVIMIKKAIRCLKVDYVLMDSWFTSERMIECVRSCTKQNVHLIGMMKMGTAKYVYKNKSYNAAELLKKGKREIGVKRCKKIKASYLVMKATYKDYPVKLFFSRFGKRGKWHLILTTDTSLSYIKVMEQYQVRWTIEVFFKESKQYLNLGGCQSKSFEAQIADTTISMIQYILLTLRKRFDDYETRGEIFRSTGEEMLEQRLHVRLWELLIMIMKIIIETLDMIVDDIDACIARLINSDKLKGILDLISPGHKAILT